MFDGPDAPETLELDARLRPNMARDTAPEIADIDAEFLYPSDADVLDISNDGDGVRVRLAVPDPETGDGLVFEAAVESVEEADFELPLDDEYYD